MLRKFRNRKNFKMAPHSQKSIVKVFFGRKMPPPLVNGSLYLSTPRNSGKSGTDFNRTRIILALN
jgi:hypothetical protein